MKCHRGVNLSSANDMNSVASANLYHGSFIEEYTNTTDNADRRRSSAFSLFYCNQRPFAILCRSHPYNTVDESANDIVSSEVLHLTCRNPSHTPLNTSRTRSLLILFQPNQQLSESLLARPSSTTLRSLPAQINQLCNTLPAGSTRASILSLCQKLVGFTAGLCNGLLLLAVIVLVEIINCFLGCLDCLSLLLLRLFSPLGKTEIAALSPLGDYFRFGLVRIG